MVAFMNSSVNHINENTIRAAQQGCRESLAQIADEAQGKVYAFLYRLTLDHHLAEDLCQETLLSLIAAIKRLDFPNDKALWAWLFRIALGKMQHHYRLQGNQRIHQKTRFNAEALTHLPARDETRPDLGLFRRETLETLLQAMASLKEEYRAVLALRCFDELSYAQIATVLGGSQLRNKMLFYRARKALKQHLHERGLGQVGLMAALGVFAWLTRPASQASAEIPALQAASLEVSGTVLIACALTHAGVLLSLVALLALTWGGVRMLQTSNSGAPPTQAYSEGALWRLPQYNGYSRPTAVHTYDPDGNGFQGVVGRGPDALVKAVDCADVLVGSAGDRDLSLILEEGHSVEVEFERPLYTEPSKDAPHLFYTGRQCRVLRVFLTDGAGQEMELPQPTCLQQNDPDSDRCEGYHIVTFNFDGLDIPFVPRTVRLEGVARNRRHGGFELTSVRAMTVAP